MSNNYTWYTESMSKGLAEHVQGRQHAAPQPRSPAGGQFMSTHCLVPGTSFANLAVKVLSTLHASSSETNMLRVCSGVIILMVSGGYHSHKMGVNLIMLK